MGQDESPLHGVEEGSGIIAQVWTSCAWNDDRLGVELLVSLGWRTV